MDRRLRDALEDLLEAYWRYREHCTRPIPRRPTPEAKEQAFAVTVLLATQVRSAIEAVLRQPGATTPHGLVSRQAAPFLDLILPPGDARWDGKKRI
jgi:hypothetical protein